MSIATEDEHAGRSPGNVEAPGVVLLNVGTALLAVGIPGANASLVATGGVAAGVALLGAVALVVRAMLVRRDPAT